MNDGPDATWALDASSRSGPDVFAPPRLDSRRCHRRRLLRGGLLEPALALVLAACAPRGDGQPATTPVADEAQAPAPARAEPAEPARLACAFEGEPGERYARDCDAEISRYQEQINALRADLERLESSAGVRLGAVHAAIGSLLERRRQICADWNACAASREEHLALYDWLSDELATLEARLQAALDQPADAVALDALRNWASSMASRRPGATTASNPGVAPASPSPAPPTAPARPPAMPAEVRARLTATLRQQEQEIAELQQILELIRQLRAASEGATAASPPPICSAGEASRQQLEDMVRGPNSTVSSFARTISDAVADLCDRYQRRATPDDRARGAIERLFAHFDRVDGWMDDILRCTLPGADQRRCTNAYGGRQPDDIEQARRAKRVVADLRQRLAGVREGRQPFPCDLEPPPELERAAWTMSTARAQMPSIARNLETVCRIIGLDAAGLEQSISRLGQRLDQAESTLGQHIRIRQDGVERIRAYTQ